MNLMLETLSIDGQLPDDLFPNLTRTLTETDLRLLSKPKAPSAKQSALKRLTERHRTVAKAVASGMSNEDVAAMSGLSTATICNYKKDISFMNLVKFMQKELDIVFETIHEKLTGMSIDAMEALRDRMEDPNEKISINQYIEIAKLGLDRSGYGPQSTHNVNLNDGLADRLSAARKRLAERTIDTTALEIKDEGPRVHEGRTQGQPSEVLRHADGESGKVSVGSEPVTRDRDAEEVAA